MNTKRDAGASTVDGGALGAGLEGSFGRGRSLAGGVDVSALDAVVSGVEALERRRRAVDAGQVGLFAEALELVERVCGGVGEREIAFRSVRAELAAVLRVSERTVERRLSHAYRLNTQYPTVLERLREGALSEAHTVVIAEAGLVIGVGVDAGTVRRRAGYEAAVVEVAVGETPARLRPVAKRLAERWAEVPLEERFEVARSRRCVRLIEGEDGMSDVIAHLPAVEASAIYDRLTRMSRHLEQQARESETAPVNGSTADRSVTDVSVADRSVAGSRGAGGAGAVGGSGAGAVGAGAQSSGGAPSSAGLPAGVSRAKRRRRDEVRADLFTDLLLTGDLENAEQVQPVGVSSIRAHVQVSITDTELFTKFLTGHAAISTVSVASEGTVRDFVNDAKASPALNAAHGSGTDATNSLAESVPGGGGAQLAGYGPIPAGVARRVAADASSWSVVTHDRVTGVVAKVASYRPTAGMRRLLQVRDEHCRFPGCRAPVQRCDLDHTVDYALGGETAVGNLAHLCRGHHVLKHHGGWKVTQRGRGVLEWRSPTGRVHVDRPHSTISRVRFRPTAPEPAGSDPGRLEPDGLEANTSAETAAGTPPAKDYPEESPF